jgi:molecular chaperone DnaK
MMGITIGIDLGTTNSVACIKRINVSTIRNAEGEELTPSCVTAIPHEDSSFDFVVGRHSRNLLKQYPEQTITSVKRLMGRDFEDTEVQSIIKDHHVSYPIGTDASEPGSIRIPLGGKMQTPEMISGLILGKLIQDGEAELQGKIDQAVVTVPAYFSDRQKFATRAACDYAGIKLLRLLPEPTAAALSFGLGELGENECRTIMVFDLGGGTFDISVLSLAGGSFMEVTKGGDMWLGGNDIDQLLVDHIFSCAQKAANCKPITELIDKFLPADKARFLVEIKEKAEAAKIELSSQEYATIEMFGLLKDEKNKLIDIDITITRAEFAQLLEPIVKRVSRIAKQILHEIRFEPELIDTVLMVGGSSLVSAIQAELRSLFGSEKVMIHPRPMFAIAEGAALMAARMTSQENLNENKPFSMMHSTAHDYYLQLANGKKHLLVARNTPLPVAVEEKLSFVHSEQSLARLRVFNEVEGVLDTVGELWFHKEDAETDLSEKMEPSELMMRFTVDEDNIITMKAWSLQNEQLCVESQIARGGLAAKLYNDLERTLSSIIANCRRGSIEDDALRLSRSVVSTILSASDPITGETRVKQKQKAQLQISTLKNCQQKNIAPLSLYRFALIAQAESENILSHQENLRLKNILDELKQALENLDDVTKFENLKKRLEEFYHDMPIASDLARAENAASIIEGDCPNEAKQIRKQAKKLADLHRHQNKVLTESTRETLYDLLDSNISWYDAPSGRFDRDVCL